MLLSKRGFTLIELLVSTVIIIILAAVASVFFGNVTKQTRISQGKADVKAIAQALEGKYDPQTGQYQEVTGSNFASGVIPVPPQGAHYVALLSSDGKGFRVCANLSDTTLCTSASCYCFCVSSSQGNYTDTSPLIFYESP